MAPLADMMPRMRGILAPGAARRAVLSVVPVPANFRLSSGNVVLCHAFIAAVPVDAESKPIAALKAAFIAVHS